ncbi:MAG TPA: GGDEF domain-containing protein [bacterium]|nr:GGDEF domain-containing protein [bacterium]
MEKEKKLLQICKYSSIILVGSLILFYTGYLQPLTSLRSLIHSAWLLIFLCGVLLYFVFTIVEHYYEELVEYNEYLKTFHEFQMEASPTMKIENLSIKILDVLIKIFNGNKAVLIINDPEIKRFSKNGEFVISSGKNTVPQIKRRGTHYFKTFYSSLIDNETKVCVDDIIKRYSLDDYSTVAVVPFANENHIVATSVVGLQNPQREFFEYIKEPVEIFSKQVSSIFESALLHQEIALASITDSLTGLYNKRYFQQRIREEFSKAKRNHFPIAVVISDLDNFKYYVDRYGHPLTDNLLFQLVSLIKNLLRESDIICRFGGDEFVYLLPFSDSLDACGVAERIKTRVVSHEFLLDENNSAFITISFGVASFPEHGDTWEEIIKNADNALFQSKEKGKNRITIYEAA